MRCEKLATLKKHMNTKHTEQKYKIFSQVLKTSMEVVIHVAKDHQEQEEVRSSSTKSDKQAKQLSFVYIQRVNVRQVTLVGEKGLQTTEGKPSEILLATLLASASASDYQGW